jgi:isoleucyl-tRNA synthetase
MSELPSVIDDVTAGFDDLKPAAAATRITEFIDLLRREYLPGAGRVPDSGGRTAEGAGQEPEPAAGTLGRSLSVLTRLMAPIAPFVTDEVWSKLLQCGALPGEPGSVHLATWPRGSLAPVDGPAGSDT